jgi:hypothetical protein
MWGWLVRDWQWPAAALFAAVFLLAMAPLVAGSAGIALALVFVQLPIYLLHQGEEHVGDRFRRYVNQVIAGGRELLTPGITFWINFLAVWVVDLAALYLAWAVDLAAGLVAGYLALVNGMVHIAQAVARREYNPGLGSAVALFLPLGGWCVWEAGAGSGPWAHAIGLGVAVGGHAVIVACLAARLARLPKSA